VRSPRARPRHPRAALLLVVVIGAPFVLAVACHVDRDEGARDWRHPFEMSEEKCDRERGRLSRSMADALASARMGCADDKDCVEVWTCSVAAYQPAGAIVSAARTTFDQATTAARNECADLDARCPPRAVSSSTPWAVRCTAGQCRIAHPFIECEEARSRIDRGLAAAATAATTAAACARDADCAILYTECGGCAPRPVGTAAAAAFREAASPLLAECADLQRQAYCVREASCVGVTPACRKGACVAVTKP